VGPIIILIVVCNPAGADEVLALLDMRNQLINGLLMPGVVGRCLLTATEK